MMNQFVRRAAFLLAVCAAPAAAQLWDFSGNSRLSGTWVFRETIYVANAAGSINRAVVLYGNITFNPAQGSYSLSGNVIDSAVGSGPYTTSGAYSIGSNGHGFLRHPYSSSGFLHGLAADGIFIASATESGINDLFIAVPASSATNATLSGNYTLGYFITQGGGPVSNSYDTVAQFAANGNGNIGTVTSRTYLGNSPAPVNVVMSNVTYSFANGIGTVRFPTTGQPPLRGDKQLMISPDGNFIFGGSIATGAGAVFDLFIGVRRGASAPEFSGLYYSAGFNHVPGALDTFYGALTARGGTILEHQRYLATSGPTPVNYTGSSVYPPGASEYTDSASAVEYTIADAGAIRIGVGQSPYLGLRLAVRAPRFSAPPGTAPYINPTGIINAASFAPFTAGLAPGELVAIFGERLSSATHVMQGGEPFPLSLNGVQVFMNNRPAAIYYVTPSLVSAIVPYGTSEPIVEVKVVRDGVESNVVYLFRYLTGPGIFSQAASGEGLGAVLRSNFSLATPANPARPGEVISVYLTGLGAVSPSIPDGAVGSSTTLNRTPPGTVRAFVDNLEAEVLYSGLVPTLAGLYQVNLRVPDNASAGNVFLDIATPDAYTSQVLLPVGPPTASSDAAPPAKAPAAVFLRRR
jgi:uncharacterized protein (TIGR03437 family)